MSYCQKCGRKNNAGANFCGSCGKEFENQTAKLASRTTMLEEDEKSVHENWLSRYLTNCFSGRISVADIWIGAILILGILVILGTIFENSDFIATLIVIFFFYYLSSLYVRRAHDLGYSAWVLIWLFIPIVSIYYGFKISFFNGENRANSYGEPVDKSESSGDRLKRLAGFE